MSKTEEEIERLSWLKRGRQRRLVYEQVSREPLTITEITNKVNKKILELKEEGKQLRIRETSRALKQLEEQKYIKCLNPAKKPGDKGIMYVKN